MVLPKEVATTLQLSIFQRLIVIFVLYCHHLQVLQLELMFLGTVAPSFGVALLTLCL